MPSLGWLLPIKCWVTPSVVKPCFELKQGRVKRMQRVNTRITITIRNNNRARSLRAWIICSWATYDINGDCYYSVRTFARCYRVSNSNRVPVPVCRCLGLLPWLMVCLLSHVKSFVYGKLFMFSYDETSEQKPA